MPYERRGANPRAESGGNERTQVEFRQFEDGAVVAEVAERFRRTFEEHQWRRHPDLVLTASFGVAELALLPADATPADLLAQADTALYASKRSGRNRVSTAGLPKAAA